MKGGGGGGDDDVAAAAVTVDAAAAGASATASASADAGVKRASQRGTVVSEGESSAHTATAGAGATTAASHDDKAPSAPPSPVQPQAHTTAAHASSLRAATPVSGTSTSAVVGAAVTGATTTTSASSLGASAADQPRPSMIVSPDRRRVMEAPPAGRARAMTGVIPDFVVGSYPVAADDSIDGMPSSSGSGGGGGGGSSTGGGGGEGADGSRADTAASIAAQDGAAGSSGVGGAAGAGAASGAAGASGGAAGAASSGSAAGAGAAGSSNRGSKSSKIKSKTRSIRRAWRRRGREIDVQHRSYELMLSLLIGIRTMTGRVSAEVDRSLAPEDFVKETKLEFPKEGTFLTPSHPGQDFKFKEYAPFVFRKLRDKFGIDAVDYMLSLTAEYDLSELGTPGKSGSMFYFTRDGRFVIKTMNDQECKFLRAILPEYYEHVMACPHTLLTRFYGLYRLKPGNIHFVVMANIIATDKEIHEQWDLKGSLQGREASEEERKSKHCTFKDLDLLQTKRTFALGPLRKPFMEQLRRDVGLLDRLGIMDYSLMVAVRRSDRALNPGARINPQLPSMLPRPGAAPVSDSEESSDSDDDSPPGTPVQAQPKVVPSPGGAAAAEAAAEAAAGASGSPAPEAAALPPRVVSMFELGTGSVVASLGAELLASDDRRLKRMSLFQQKDGGLLSKRMGEYYYMGIIDILQPYSARKQLEHFFKGMKYDRKEISCVPPSVYASRFLEFMDKAVV